MKLGVVVFPGSNCDHDCYHVLSEVLNLDTQFLWHKETNIKNVDAIVLPGGFSYGDYLRPGAIAHYSPIMKEVIRFAESGGPVLGICNGFQVLTETHLLPGSLIRNRTLKFICDTPYLKWENNSSRFSQAYQVGEVSRIPIAHMEGNYFIDSENLKHLEDQGQVLFRYCDQNGNVSDSDNPNGSVNNIAGVQNKKGNVVGMMPHPERVSEDLLGSQDGLKVFQSLLA